MRIWEDVKKQFQEQKNVIIHRGKSEKILQEFKDSYFDWVYIDGNHAYEFVIQDLRISFDKVKPGGIIAGDDCLWGKDDDYPVRRAVIDFTKESHLENNLKFIDSQFIIKL